MGRLFKILYLLLERKKITAKELSDILEVSVRTIYRDIDKLSLYNIPIYTEKGKGGGIFLDPNFIFDKTLLSDDEQKAILSTVQDMALTGDKESLNLFEKLKGTFNKSPSNWMQVDFSNWGDNDKFDTIKNCVQNNYKIKLEYYNSNGQKKSRIIYPTKLYFKSNNWYCWAYCETACDFRLFKLTRCRNLEVLKENFEIIDKPIPEDYLTEDKKEKPITVKLRISQKYGFRVYDEFSNDNIVVLSDGNFEITFNTWGGDSRLYSYVMSFGTDAEILEPPHIKEKLRDLALEIYKKNL